MTDWKTVQLGDVLKITSSKRIFHSDYVVSGIPFYRSKEIIEKQKGNEISQNLFISREKFNEFDEKFGSPKSGDLLLTSVGTLGIPYLVRNDEKFYFKDGNLTWFTNFCGIDSLFFYYWVLSATGKEKLNEITIGSTQSALTIVGLKNIEINLPPLPEQKRIAHILSTFDKKIELLQKQNKTLEAIVQNLYKRWFVDFEFPNENGKPYKSGGGKMISSELGEIPEGWEVVKLEQLVKVVNGYSYKGHELREDSTQALVTLKSFNRNGGFQTRGFKPFKGLPKESQRVLVGDLIVAHTDLTQDAYVLGNPVLIFEDGGFREMFITMDLVKIVPAKSVISSVFLYSLMKMMSFKQHCVGYSNGTTVLHLSKRAIPNYEIALPKNLDLIEKFSKSSSQVVEKISANIHQKNIIVTLRDLSLKQLIH